MAEVAVEKGEHNELVQFAKTMIEDQKKEIETLDGIIEDLDGPDEVATETHPHERSMLGMDSPEELAKKAPFDKAFIDSQLPHHASAIEMAEAFIRDKKRVIPCASLCEGEFGIEGYFIGVPSVIGAGGVENILEFALTDEEQSELNYTLEAVKKTVAETGL